MEIGVGHGGGLKFLHDSFEQANIFGSDQTYSLLKVDLKTLPRVKLLPTSDQIDINTNLLPKLDIVIEDASHQFKYSIQTFDRLKNSLNKGAIYIIEDVYPEFVNLYKKTRPEFVLHDLSQIKNRNDDRCAVYVNL